MQASSWIDASDAMDGHLHVGQRGRRPTWRRSASRMPVAAESSLAGRSLALRRWGPGVA